MIQARADALKASDRDNPAPIPVDLVMVPKLPAVGWLHISVAAALYQFHRVAKARSMSDEAVKDLVNQYTEADSWAFWQSSG